MFFSWLASFIYNFCSPPHLSWGMICKVFCFSNTPLTTTDKQVWHDYSFEDVSRVFIAIATGVFMYHKWWVKTTQGLKSKEDNIFNLFSFPYRTYENWKRMLERRRHYERTYCWCFRNLAIASWNGIYLIICMVSYMPSAYLGFPFINIVLKASGENRPQNLLWFGSWKMFAKLHAFQNSWEPSRGVHGFMVGMKVLHIFPFRWFHGFPEVFIDKMGSQNQRWWILRNSRS